MFRGMCKGLRKLHRQMWTEHELSPEVSRGKDEVSRRLQSAGGLEPPRCGHVGTFTGANVPESVRIVGGTRHANY